MPVADYAITFACYNQVGYTRQFVESLVASGIDLARVAAVDNGSTDGTRQYLETLALGARILNKANLGCGVAWDQGALALQAEWTVVMNNDVLVSPGWLEGLIEAANSRRWRLVSPALVEGPADYDFTSFAGEAGSRMKNVHRDGGRHAICVAVHSSVWMDIGYFRPAPKMFGYEDTLFFHDADGAGIPMGITGSSWLHHFGSITVKALKEERGLSGKQGLSHRRTYRVLGQSWLERKVKKWRQIRQRRAWREREVAQYGMSLHGLRREGQFEWI